jgi:hypothetical protein
VTSNSLAGNDEERAFIFMFSGENWNVVSLRFFLSDDGALHLGELESLRVHEPHDL